MRYLPIVDIVRSRGYESAVTEVGSGGTGIGPYLKRPFVGVDQDFGVEQSPYLDPVVASVLKLPFQDGSRACVVSTDMLEHLPGDLRPGALDELVRVTGDLLVVAVPAGPRAMAQDKRLDTRYLRRHGERFPFLVEHLDYGLPTAESFDRDLGDALRSHGWTTRPTYLWNSNLRIREGLMRLWIGGGPLRSVLLLLANYAHPVLRWANRGACYRLVAVVSR